jgi:hypothetical protein
MAHPVAPPLRVGRRQSSTPPICYLALPYVAGSEPTSLRTIVLAGSNYSSEHTNFYVPVQIGFGVVNDS